MVRYLEKLVRVHRPLRLKVCFLVFSLAATTGFVSGGLEKKPIFNSINQGPDPFFIVPELTDKVEEASKIGKEYACGICHALVNLVDLFHGPSGKDIVNALVLKEENGSFNVKYKSIEEKMHIAVKEVCQNMPQGKEVMKDEGLRVCNNVIDLHLQHMIDDRSTGISLDDYCQGTAMICASKFTRDHLDKASKLWGEIQEEEIKKTNQAKDEDLDRGAGEQTEL